MSRKKYFAKRLLKGKFYYHADTKGGHPAYLYKKKDNKNMYFVILFSTSYRYGRRKLKKSIEPGRNKESYATENPSIVKRRELSSKELTRLRIHKVDKPTIEVIKRKK